MSKSTITAAAAAALTLASSVASAQSFNDRGNFIMGVDRLTGFTHARVRIDPDAPGTDNLVKANSFGLFGQQNQRAIYGFPRFAFDYMITDGLTIGGSLSYSMSKGEVDPDPDDESPAPVPTFDLQDTSGFLFAPRVGYAFMFVEAVGFWPRGGLTVFTGNPEDQAGIGGGGDADFTVVALSLDAPFVFVPVDHMAILFGPAFDIGLAGGGDYNVGGFNSDFGAKAHEIGAHAGFLLWL